MVHTFNGTTPVYITRAVGDYDISIDETGCECDATICTDPYIVGAAAAPPPTPSNEIEYAIVCSSIDGRQLLQRMDNTASTATGVFTLLELDGSALTDASTSVACAQSVDYEKTETCLLDPATNRRYTHIRYFDVTNPASSVSDFFADDTGMVLPVGTQPTTLVPCPESLAYNSTERCFIDSSNNDRKVTMITLFDQFGAFVTNIYTYADDPLGAVITPTPDPSDLDPCPEEEYAPYEQCYTATAAGTGYSVGDVIQIRTTYSPRGGNIVWFQIFNSTTQAVIYSEVGGVASGTRPPVADLSPCETEEPVIPNTPENDAEYSAVCSSIDGRELLQQLVTNPVTGAITANLVEVDGSPLADASTAVACPDPVDYEVVRTCFEDQSTAPPTRYQALRYYDVTNPSVLVFNIVTDNRGAILAPGTVPSGLTPCPSPAGSYSQLQQCFRMIAPFTTTTGFTNNIGDIIIRRVNFLNNNVRNVSFQADTNVTQNNSSFFRNLETGATAGTQIPNANMIACEELDHQTLVDECFRVTTAIPPAIPGRSGAAVGDILTRRTLADGINPGVADYEIWLNRTDDSQGNGGVMYVRNQSGGTSGAVPPRTSMEPCEAGGGAVTPQNSPVRVEFINSSGEPFVAVQEYNDAGVLQSTTWLDRDGSVLSTAPTGLRLAQPGKDFVKQELCDQLPTGTFVSFIRRMEWDDFTQAFRSTDVQLDGVTPYTPVGTVSNCKDLPITQCNPGTGACNLNQLEVRTASSITNGSMSYTINNAATCQTSWTIDDLPLQIWRHFRDMMQNVSPASNGTPNEFLIFTVNGFGSAANATFVLPKWAITNAVFTSPGIGQTRVVFDWDFSATPPNGCPNPTIYRGFGGSFYEAFILGDTQGGAATCGANGLAFSDPAVTIVDQQSQSVELLQPAGVDTSVSMRTVPCKTTHSELICTENQGLVKMVTITNIAGEPVDTQFYNLQTNALIVTPLGAIGGDCAPQTNPVPIRSWRARQFAFNNVFLTNSGGSITLAALLSGVQRGVRNVEVTYQRGGNANNTVEVTGPAGDVFQLYLGNSADFGRYLGDALLDNAGAVTVSLGSNPGGNNTDSQFIISWDELI